MRPNDGHDILKGTRLVHTLWLPVVNQLGH